MFRFVASILVAICAQAVGGVLTYHSVSTWYPGLAKPAFTPPSWVFAPVWTVLYLMMGVAAWLVWRRVEENPVVRPALAAYGVQLVLNVGWSLFFFALQAPLAGLADILALLGLIALTTMFFFRVSLAAGFLMIPYFAWVSYAAVLNAAIVMMN